MKNGIMMQYFEWNWPNTGKLWQELNRDVSHLYEIGITSVWMSPAYKAHEQQDKGYGTKQKLWVANHPELTVTFADNHDSQKNGSLESQIKVIRMLLGLSVQAIQCIRDQGWFCCYLTARMEIKSCRWIKNIKEKFGIK